MGWLKKNATRKGHRTLFKIPVVVLYTDKHRFGIGRAFVGTSIKDPGDDKLPLQLDDTALGISLRDRLRQKCDKKAAGCALWIEGHWGPLLQGGPKIPPTPGKTAPAHRFAVRAVGGLVKDNAAKAMIAK